MAAANSLEENLSPYNAVASGKNECTVSNQESESIYKDIAEFKEQYFSDQGGKYSLEGQIPHLKKLANHYYTRYQNTDDWKDCLKAHALYNSAAARDKYRSTRHTWNKLIFQAQQAFWKQKSAIKLETHCKTTRELQDELASVRARARTSLETLHLKELLTSLDSQAVNNIQNIQEFTLAVKEVSLQCTEDLKALFTELITKAVESLTHDPPCPFMVVVLGSLARGEATPYSDLEYIFLTKRMTPQIEEYFELLAVTTYFLIGNFRETNLAYLDIEELKGWFEDGATDGFKIDGLQEKAGNIPTGNCLGDSRNKYIMTLDGFVKEYRHIYVNPDETTALRGDMTAMVKYMKVVHAHQMDATSLQMIHKEMKDVYTPTMRAIMNERMLHCDVSKFDFKPSGDLEGQGYTIDVKKDIFRFPSIILLDLAIVFGVWCNSTWDVPAVLRSKHELPQNTATSLSFLLASACYVRMAAYLYHQAHDDRISVAERSVNIRRPLILSDSAAIATRRYFLPNNIFNIICEHSIPLNDALKELQVYDLSRMQLPEVSWQSKTKVLHCTGRFTDALKTVKDELNKRGSFLSDEDLPNVLERHCSQEVMGVIAEIFLRCSEYPTALAVYKHLSEIAPNDRHKLRMAECFRKLKCFTKCVDVLQLITTDSDEKSYQLGLAYSSNDNQRSLAKRHLLAALHSSTRGLQRTPTSLEDDTAEFKPDSLSTLTPTPQTANCLMALGEWYRKQEDHANASLCLKKSFEILSCVYGLEAVVPSVGHFLRQNAMLHRDMGEQEMAIDYFVKSLILYQQMYGDELNHIYVSDVCSNLAKLEKYDLDSDSDSEELILRSLRIYKEIHGKNYKLMARVHKRLGETLMEMQDHRRALHYHLKALDLYKNPVVDRAFLDENTSKRISSIQKKIVACCSQLNFPVEGEENNSQLLALPNRNSNSNEVSLPIVWSLLGCSSLNHIEIPNTHVKKAHEIARLINSSTAAENHTEQLRTLVLNIAAELFSSTLYEQAAQCYAQALDITAASQHETDMGGNTETVYKLWLSCMRGNCLDRADPYVRRSLDELEDNETTADLWEMYGQGWFILKRSNICKYYLEKSFDVHLSYSNGEVNQKAWEILVLLGDLNGDLKHHEQALKWYTLALRQDSQQMTSRNISLLTKIINIDSLCPQQKNKYRTHLLCERSRLNYWNDVTVKELKEAFSNKWMARFPTYQRLKVCKWYLRAIDVYKILASRDSGIKMMQLLLDISRSHDSNIKSQAYLNEALNIATRAKIPLNLAGTIIDRYVHVSLFTRRIDMADMHLIEYLDICEDDVANDNQREELANKWLEVGTMWMDARKDLMAKTYFYRALTLYVKLSTDRREQCVTKTQQILQELSKRSQPVPKCTATTSPPPNSSLMISITHKSSSTPPIDDDRPPIPPRMYVPHHMPPESDTTTTTPSIDDDQPPIPQRTYRTSLMPPEPDSSTSTTTPTTTSTITSTMTSTTTD